MLNKDGSIYYIDDNILKGMREEFDYEMIYLQFMILTRKNFNN